MLTKIDPKYTHGCLLVPVTGQMGSLVWSILLWKGTIPFLPLPHGPKSPGTTVYCKRSEQEINGMRKEVKLPKKLVNEEILPGGMALCKPIYRHRTFIKHS